MKAKDRGMKRSKIRKKWDSEFKDKGRSDCKSSKELHTSISRANKNMAINNGLN